MNLLASFLLVAAVWLAVFLGPQLSPWSWGASLLATGAAVLMALPGLWRGTSRSPGGWLLGTGAVTLVWFAMRAWMSPVAEHGMMDLLLLAATVGGFLVMRGTQDGVGAERVTVWGIGILLLASAVVVCWQAKDPDFSPGLVARFPLPSGFFGHYNYGANFLIGTSCLVGGVALFDRRLRLAERVVLGVVALVGIGAVYLTGSRGGQIGAVAAVAVFVGLAMVVGLRQGSKWFAPGVVVLPLVGIGLAVFLIHGWARSQELRGQDTGVDSVVDNAIRLHLAGIAASCVAEHPWQGGGSRSFSWECNRFWDNDSHGQSRGRPEQVHNEILQAATDYGLIGAALLVLFIGSVMVGGLLKLLFGETGTGAADGYSWLVGGLAGLAGLLVHSNFCFVFHPVPGALVLGVALGRATYVSGSAERRGRLVRSGARMVAVGGAVACGALMLPLGWRGTRVTCVRWADAFGQNPTRDRRAVEAALEQSVAIWPLEEFYLQLAAIHQHWASDATEPDEHRKWVERALGDYENATKLYPFNPVSAANRAVILSAEGDNAAAEAEFARAIRLQGGMESTYRVWHHLARHCFIKAERQLRQGETEAALGTTEEAVEAMEKAVRDTPPWLIDRDLRLSIHERLGLIRGFQGDEAGALEAYQFMTVILPGSRGHYRAASLLVKRANRVWLDRKPAEALADFLSAKEHYAETSAFPEDVSVTERVALWQYINSKITDLRAAKIEPAPRAQPQ